MGPTARIFKKVVEFLGCVACLLGKFFTDIEARRVFLTRQKWSREWSLLHNIFWNTKGDAFAWITYGGYSIITLLFGISICIDSKSRPTYAEKIFLFIGSLMFFAVGGLVLASIDQVPDELIDNAIVLGCLSFFVAFVFLIDMSEKMGKRRTDSTQTDTSSIDRHFTKSQSMTTINSQANLMDSDDNGKNRDSMRSTNTQREISTQQTQQNQQSLNPFVNHQQNGEQRHQPLSHEQSFHVHYPEGSQPPQSIRSTQHFPTTTYSEDVVETQTLPTAQTAVFSKVKQPPTLINHFETEPYKKILSRTNQPVPVVYTRYHDPAQHHNDPSFYDDFNDYRKQTYYQGPKVDQGKLVIRDYSHQPTQQQKHACNCPNHHDDETEGNEQNNVTIKSGYVSQVAKLWDNRMKSNEGSVRIHQKDIRGLNTVV